MKMLIGLILIVVGVGVALYGIGGAVQSFAGMYASALDDPLNAPDGQEEQVSKDMLHYAMIGGVGAPPLLVGSILFLSSFRTKRKKRRRVGRSAPGAGGW